jgi:hypothetical protein
MRVCAQVIGALGRNGHDAVKQEAMKRMYSSGGWQSMPADLRFAVYSIVVAHGGAEGFEAVQYIKLVLFFLFFFLRELVKKSKPNNTLKTKLTPYTKRK